MQAMKARTVAFAATAINKRSFQVAKRFKSSSSSSMQTHIIFGANTDVGKTLVSAGLVRSALHSNPSSPVGYIKPLQCGGNDESAVSRYGVGKDEADMKRFISRILFLWDTPASPHLASRVENKPVSDGEVISSLQEALTYMDKEGGALAEGNANMRTIIETAGGVLSPSSASPHNSLPSHARALSSDTLESSSSWGWSAQADLYQPLNIPAVLVGDGRLGGISCTLSALESLIFRGYDVHGIILVDDGGGYGNVTALREYACRRVPKSTSYSANGDFSFQQNPDRSIVSLPALPPMPEPLYEWYDSPQVQETFASFHDMLGEAACQ